jgi:hypothetical protein
MKKIILMSLFIVIILSVNGFAYDPNPNVKIDVVKFVGDVCYVKVTNYGNVPCSWFLETKELGTIFPFYKMTICRTIYPNESDVFQFSTNVNFFVINIYVRTLDNGNVLTDSKLAYNNNKDKNNYN